MIHFRKKNSTPSPGSWLCPHCFRREPYARHLVRTRDMIPLEQDRKQYWYRVSIGAPVGPQELTHRLAEGCLLGEQSAEQLLRDELRGCVHCHMSSEEAWAGADMYQAIASSAAARDALVRSLGRSPWQHDGAAVNWSTLMDTGISQRFGLCLADRRWELAVSAPADVLPENGYRRELMDRISQEAAGYLFVLDLTQEDSDIHISQELDWLAQIHADELPLKQRASTVILLPGGETMERYGVISFQLEYMFPGREPRIVTDPTQMNDALPQALWQLLELNGPETPVQEDVINVDAGG